MAFGWKKLWLPITVALGDLRFFLKPHNSTKQRPAHHWTSGSRGRTSGEGQKQSDASLKLFTTAQLPLQVSSTAPDPASKAMFPLSLSSS